LAVRPAHFLATSAVTADALPFMHPTAMQTNPTSALSNFTWANMVYPKAKHRGLTIPGLTVSVACIATKSAASCTSWVRPGRSAMSDQCPNCPPKADFPILELPPPRTFPAGFIAPCLPTKTDKLPSGSDWLHKIKHDGFRVSLAATPARR